MKAIWYLVAFPILCERHARPNCHEYTLSNRKNCVKGQYLPCNRIRLHLPNYLARNVFSSSFLVVHNTGRCSEDDVSELTRRQKFNDPLLEIRNPHIVARADNTSFVDTERRELVTESRLARRIYLPAIELNNDLAGAVVIHLLKFSYVACIQTILAMLRSIKRLTS
jgi:hypothetical protein